ncbi:unnamed protein product [Brassica oleracea var. botrytis]
MLLIIMMSIAAIYDPFCYPDILPIIFQATLMPATVNASRAPTFQPHLTAGAMYSIAGFDVARCNPNFRLLFDSNAISFHKRLEVMRGDPRKWLEQKKKKRLYLSATSRTHIYFDKETNVGESYFCKLVSTDTRLPSAAPLLRDILRLRLWPYLSLMSLSSQLQLREATTTMDLQVTTQSL